MIFRALTKNYMKANDMIQAQYKRQKQEGRHDQQCEDNIQVHYP